ncbi:uncharacterized protein LOC131328411 [Rhododendron vialii]|uniref:uncharacterized protein LOC131328411 n=1 Tax=Rhododendron vialii TaxID=182163 RepID=UPI00265F2343|nr:uncharacterized protein LOC131328411 [Rhododendron vialii]
MDPSKIQAIMEISPPKTEKEVRSFLGKVQFINKFISKLTTTCDTLSKLLKKDTDFEWSQDCQQSFEAIKEYLQNPPVLSPPILGKPLILYLSLYFDGASNQCGYGIGVLLVSPNDSHIPLSYKLRYEVTNNQAEYEACIARMEASLELGAKRVEVIGDSNLVVSQARGDWKVKEDTLKLYHFVLETLIPQFHFVIFTHTPRMSIRFANVLATLASMVKISLGFIMRPLMIEQKVKPACKCTFTEEGENDGKPWYEDMKKFLEEGEYPFEATSKDKMAL